MGHKKAEDIETLFQLYDMLEASCQETLKETMKGGNTVPSKETAAASQLLEELRIRFVRLVRPFPAVHCSESLATTLCRVAVQ